MCVCVCVCVRMCVCVCVCVCLCARARGFGVGDVQCAHVGWEAAGCVTAALQSPQHTLTPLAPRSFPSPRRAPRAPAASFPVASFSSSSSLARCFSAASRSLASALRAFSAVAFASCGCVLESVCRDACAHVCVCVWRVCMFVFVCVCLWMFVCSVFSVCVCVCVCV